MQAAGIKTRADVESLLNQHSITYKVHTHAPVTTMDEMKKEVPLEKAPFIKNLFYEDSKKGLSFLILAHNETKVGKLFWKTLGLSHNNVRIGKFENLQKILATFPGAVNPFCLVNDNEHKIKDLVIDSALNAHEYLAFHPNDNTATIEMKRQDFLKLLEVIGRTPKILALNDDAEDYKAKQPTQEAKTEDSQGTKLKMEYQKEKDFSNWYSEVIHKAELVDNYNISGCYILKPWSFFIWEQVTAFFDADIKKLGVENAYFPMFITKKQLETEKDHVEGFTPEVAWVTKSGGSDLQEPIAIRPTSETIMYPSFAKWIRSWRDLPIKINQWCNVVRWEFKHPTPFVRTREFLWQEGHTAHATKEEADQMVYDILDLYEKVYRELLAIPVIKGKKSENEKFAGGFYTTSVESFSPANGRGIQAATSHQLGQNFSKMFKIDFENKKGEKNLAWQTSWGLSTRSIGTLVMHHGDDKGLVLPPRVAQYQVVIIPVYIKNKDYTEEDIINNCNTIKKILNESNIRAHIDARDNYTPGWKFNYWELKGVPLRYELGPQDIKKKEVKSVRRFDGIKGQLSWEKLGENTKKILDEIQEAMYQKASAVFKSRIVEASDWSAFMVELNKQNVVLTPWCDEKECEKLISKRSAEESKALSESENQVQLTSACKSLNIPQDQKPLNPGEKCFHCGKDAKVRIMWGRSY